MKPRSSEQMQERLTLTRNEENQASYGESLESYGESLESCGENLESCGVSQKSDAILESCGDREGASNHP